MADGQKLRIRMIVTVGDYIPLNLKLFDDSPSEKVTADIFTNKGDRYKSVSLFHVETGLYINTDTPMPNVESVIVVYKVLDTDKYADASDIFYSKPAPVDEPKFIYGVVESKENRSEYITGVVHEITNKK
jgi:hypothetical protein